MDIKEIQNLIKFISKINIGEVKYKTADFKISIKNNASSTTTNVNNTPIQAIPQQIFQPQPTQMVETSEKSNTTNNKEAENPNLIIIKSPIIGTFYRKPSPDKEPFVEVGKNIAKGNIICVIEAMKLFNEIESEHNGKIVEILVDDMTPVEFDQPLFVIDPS